MKTKILNMMNLLFQPIFRNLVEEVEENMMELEDLIEEQETEKKILDAKVQFIIHRYCLFDIIIFTVIAIMKKQKSPMKQHKHRNERTP